MAASLNRALRTAQGKLRRIEVRMRGLQDKVLELEGKMNLYQSEVDNICSASTSDWDSRRIKQCQKLYGRCVQKRKEKLAEIDALAESYEEWEKYIVRLTRNV